MRVMEVSTVVQSLLVFKRPDQIQTASKRVSVHPSSRADCPLKAAVWVRGPRNKMSSLCSHIHLYHSSPVSSTADVSKAARAEKVDRWEQQRTVPALTSSVLLLPLDPLTECRGLLLTPLADASDAVSRAGLWQMEQLVGQEEPSTALCRHLHPATQHTRGRLHQQPHLPAVLEAAH